MNSTFICERLAQPRESKQGSNALQLGTKAAVDNDWADAKEFKRLYCEADHTGILEAVELIEEQQEQ